jgi:hypothetical protein
MNNNTIFSKSILCALALFGFSSATAMQDYSAKVVFVGRDNFSLLQKIANEGDSTLTYTTHEGECTARLLATAIQSEYSPLMPNYCRNATQFVIACSTPEEFEHHLLKIFDVDDEVKEKAIVAFYQGATDPGDYDKIMAAYPQIPLYFVSLETNNGIDEMREKIATRCLERQRRERDSFQGVRLDAEPQDKCNC